MNHAELVREIIHLGFDLQESDAVEDMDFERLKDVRDILKELRDYPDWRFDIGIV